MLVPRLLWNIPRLIGNGWQPAIVDTDDGDLGVFTGRETRQLVLMSKRTLPASLRPTAG